MAEIQKIEQKKEADRCTALIALAAGKASDGQTTCLDVDELAGLVDHQCSSDDQERYFAHLANCETCYRQWLDLSELTQASTAKSKKRKLRPGYFAWAGSALAAAASVVLFLNITRQAPLPVIQKNKLPMAERSLAPSSAVGQGEQKFDSQIKSAAQETVEELKNTVPLEELSVPIASPPKKEISNASKSVLAKKQKARPALEKEVPVMETSHDMVTESFGQARVDFGRVEIDGWIQRIQQGCFDDEAKTKFWQQQALEGERLIRGEVFNRPEEEKLVNDILLLVVQLRDVPETRQQVCNRIQERIVRNRTR